MNLYLRSFIYNEQDLCLTIFILYYELAKISIAPHQKGRYCLYVNEQVFNYLYYTIGSSKLQSPTLFGRIMSS